jgi:hypothetical protein
MKDFFKGFLIGSGIVGVCIAAIVTVAFLTITYGFVGCIIGFSIAFGIFGGVMNVIFN